MTILAWSRRTLRSVCYHGISCHPNVSWKVAPAGVSSSVVSAAICISFCVIVHSLFVMKDQTEVSPLSCEGDLLSLPLQHSLCLFRPPLSAPLWASFTVCFPLVGEVQTYHVPLTYPDGLGSACSPVIVCPRGRTLEPPYRSRAFWFKPLSIFGLFVVTAFSTVHVC